jgi:DNA-directed RNA polymerase specialized sigma24 family protein
MMEDEGRKRFWDAAAGVLTDEQMAAVWLYYVEGLSAPEVAKVLGRSWVSVKTMLFRARRRLAPALEYAISDRKSASGLRMLAPMAVTAG